MLQSLARPVKRIGYSFPHEGCEEGNGQAKRHLGKGMATSQDDAAPEILHVVLMIIFPCKLAIVVAENLSLNLSPPGVRGVPVIPEHPHGQRFLIP